MIHVPATAHGPARLATPDEIEREQIQHFLATDSQAFLMTDSEYFLVPNAPNYGYTNPDLHRRVYDEITAPVGSDYPFVVYDDEGKPYPQSVKLGVWDGVHSYRTTTTYTHDEESTTCEIP